MFALLGGPADVDDVTQRNEGDEKTQIQKWMAPHDDQKEAIADKSS